MASTAAFFDLDRTVLKGASGPLLTEALQAAGIAPGGSVPGQGILYRLFDIVGETLPSIALARAAARVARGWSRAAVREAAAEAAVQLDTLVAPYARGLIDEHRRAGRPVVLTTTTPHDLIEPFADRMGFDAVLATRYEEDAAGNYTGRLSGDFVWSAGKARTVRRWATDQSVDLAGSYAYSDSVYDLPLLSMVGHPTAVNPDPRLQAVATVRRWPVVWLDVPPGVPKVAGIEPFDVVRLGARPELFPYARFEFDGLENIPPMGGAIIAANHRSYFDVVAMALVVARAGRPLRFLGKKEVFDAPVVGWLAKSLGGIRVDRGSETAGDSLREATAALAAGELIGIMPQGTIPRGEAFFDPKLVGKTGAMRLAAATGAPIIPVGVWGTEKVWPRSSRIPNIVNVTSPPTVSVRVGRPLALGQGDIRSDTETMMAAIVDLLPSEARVQHVPTEEELRKARPAGS